MRVFWATCLTAITLASATAADAGWGVQFHYDAFADKTYPLGIMQEQTEGVAFGASTLLMACKDASPVFVWQSGGFSIGDAPEAVKFRGSTGAEEFEFKATEIEPFGRRLALTGESASKLAGIFSAANGPVPYQAEAKSGNFPVAGFKDVSGIISERCAGL